MTQFQIFALVICGIIGSTYLVDMKYIKSFLGNLFMPQQTTKVQTVETGTYKLHEIVEQWEKLKEMCESQGLTSAAKNLDTVYLALLKKE